MDRGSGHLLEVETDAVAECPAHSVQPWPASVNTCCAAASISRLRMPRFDDCDTGCLGPSIRLVQLALSRSPTEGRPQTCASGWRSSPDSAARHRRRPGRLGSTTFSEVVPCSHPERWPELTKTGVATPLPPALRIAYSISAPTSFSEMPWPEEPNRGRLDAGPSNLRRVRHQRHFFVVFDQPQLIHHFRDIDNFDLRVRALEHVQAGMPAY